MTATATRSITCPKCRASYKVAGDFVGKAKCKKCQASFMVGITEAQSRGRKTRDEVDRRAAKKLMIFGGVAIALILILVIATKGSGGDKPGTDSYDPAAALARREQERRRQDAIARNAAIEAGLDPDTGQPRSAPGARAASEAWRQHPGKIADRFIEALAGQDREAVERVFDMEDYLAWAERAHADPGKFVSTPEQIAQWSTLSWGEMLDAERAAWLQKIVQEFGKGDPTGYRNLHSVTPDKATAEYTVKDSSGKPIFEIRVELKARETGRYEQEDDWIVNAAFDRWHEPGLRVEKPERRFTDIAIGRVYLEMLRANRRAAEGPPQADPMRQGPAPGCDIQTFRALEQAVAVLVDPNSAARPYAEARNTLVDAGRNAIPALLNYLVDKNHESNTEDIRNSNMVVMTLREITGESFGYAPGQARGLGQSLVTATGEERVVAVRRWFGWWNTKGRSFTGKKTTGPEDEDDLK